MKTFRKIWNGYLRFSIVEFKDSPCEEKLEVVWESGMHSSVPAACLLIGIGFVEAEGQLVEEGELFSVDAPVVVAARALCAQHFVNRPQAQERLAVSNLEVTLARLYHYLCCQRILSGFHLLFGLSAKLAVVQLCRLHSKAQNARNRLFQLPLKILQFLWSGPRHCSQCLLTFNLRKWRYLFVFRISDITLGAFRIYNTRECALIAGCMQILAQDHWGSSIELIILIANYAVFFHAVLRMPKQAKDLRNYLSNGFVNMFLLYDDCDQMPSRKSLF